MTIKKIQNPVLRNAAEYGLITLSILFMSVGVYFFKFPNHFSFGGVSGLASDISCLTGISSSLFTNAANVVLLILGFVFLGTGVGIRTVYSTVVMTVSLALLERFVPLTQPLTDQPLLDLIYAILLPGIASAILFDIDASSGGTDILAMILKKYTSMNIAYALMLADLTAVALSFFCFGVQTGLLSILGLFMKTLIIDTVMESLHLTKCFNIVCDNPDPICDFIIRDIQHSATIYQAVGAYTHQKKYVVMTMLSRRQAIRLRNFIRMHEPGAFIQITNSSEIIGKGFEDL